MTNTWFKVEVVKPQNTDSSAYKQHPHNRVGTQMWAQKLDDGRFYIFSGSHYNLPDTITAEKAKEMLKTVRRNGKVVYATADEAKRIEEQRTWALSS